VPPQLVDQVLFESVDGLCRIWRANRQWGGRPVCLAAHGLARGPRPGIFERHQKRLRACRLIAGFERGSGQPGSGPCGTRRPSFPTAQSRRWSGSRRAFLAGHPDYWSRVWAVFVFIRSGAPAPGVSGEGGCRGATSGRMERRRHQTSMQRLRDVHGPGGRFRPSAMHLRFGYARRSGRQDYRCYLIRMESLYIYLNFVI